jgi:N-glycosylase/DNA lyase
MPRSSQRALYRAVFPDASPETVSTRDAETLEWIRDYFRLDVNLVKLYD